MDLNLGGACESLRQEYLSYAYVSAIGAAAGYEVELKGRITDNAGIDIAIRVPGAIDDCYSPILEAQVKCTYQDCIKNNLISHRIKIKNYNRLVSKSYVPNILIVVLVDRDIVNWIKTGKKLDRKCTIVKASGYWTSLKGEKILAGNANGKTTVKVPTSNRLTTESLIEIMAKVAKWKDL